MGKRSNGDPEELNLLWLMHWEWIYEHIIRFFSIPAEAGESFSDKYVLWSPRWLQATPWTINRHFAALAFCYFYTEPKSDAKRAWIQFDDPY